MDKLKYKFPLSISGGRELLMDNEYINIKIRYDPLGKEIDKAIKNLKDSLGLPIYRSRTDFVETAVKMLLMHHQKKKAEVAINA
jgi:hypothetical protein